MVLSFVPDYQLTGLALLPLSLGSQTVTGNGSRLSASARTPKIWMNLSNIKLPGLSSSLQHLFPLALGATPPPTPPPPTTSLRAHRPPRPAPSWGWAHRHSCCQSWNESLLLSVQGQHRLGRHIAWLNGIRKKRKAVQSMIKTEGCLSLARLRPSTPVYVAECTPWTLFLLFDAACVRSTGPELGYSALGSLRSFLRGGAALDGRFFGKFISFAFGVL